MRTVKSALLGAVAGLVVVATGQAADMPVKAKPVQYVKICSAYGDGFYYIPGTDTCLKLGGFLRVQAEYNAGAGAIAIGSGTTEAPQARFDRASTNDVNYRTRVAVSWDVRQQTEYGPLRTYIRTGIQLTTPSDTEGGVVYWDRAFLQFAGFTVGKTLSFFDIFTYAGTYAIHDPRVDGDTTISNGLTVWGYTAQFANGVSATLSLESPVGHSRQPVVDATVAGFFAVNGAIAGDTAFSSNAGGNGFRMPDVVANWRVDQAWGYAGVSAAAHEAGGAYYLTPNNVNNGHPADKLGWAVAAGAKINLPGGDIVGINACYTEGAVGYCTRNGSQQLYNASTSVAAGWAVDGIFAPGSEVELTRVWSVLAAYEHVWSARWRTSWFGGYVNVDYNGTATGILNSALAAGSVCARPFAGLAGNLSAVRADVGNSCNPDFSLYEIGTRTQWNPVPQLDIALEVLYTHYNTAYKGPALYSANAPRPAVTLLDDQNVWSAMFRWQRNFYP
jgi:porin-like protein